MLPEREYMEQENEIKTKMLHEARTLFLKYGFKSITMDDISRELGASKKTLYQYFKDKQDLVQQCMEHQLADMNGQCDLIRKTSEDPITAMLDITEFIGSFIRVLTPSAMFDLKKYFKGEWDKLESNRKEYVLQSVTENIESGKKKGLYRKDIDTTATAKIYTTLIKLVTDPDNYEFSDMDLKALHLEIIKYHLRSICTPKGIELLEVKLKQIK